LWERKSNIGLIAPACGNKLYCQPKAKKKKPKLDQKNASALVVDEQIL